jgi:ubiquitin C-terminal hydrolase
MAAVEGKTYKFTVGENNTVHLYNDGHEERPHTRIRFQLANHTTTNQRFLHVWLKFREYDAAAFESDDNAYDNLRVPKLLHFFEKEVLNKLFKAQKIKDTDGKFIKLDMQLLFAAFCFPQATTNTTSGRNGRVEKGGVYQYIREINFVATMSTSLAVRFAPLRFSTLKRMVNPMRPSNVPRYSRANLLANLKQHQQQMAFVDHMEKDRCAQLIKHAASRVGTTNEAGNFDDDGANKFVNAEVAKLVYLCATGQRFLGSVDQKHILKLKTKLCQKTAQALKAKPNPQGLVEADENMNMRFEVVFFAEETKQDRNTLHENDQEAKSGDKQGTDDESGESSNSSSVYEPENEPEDKKDTDDESGESSDISSVDKDGYAYLALFNPNVTCFANSIIQALLSVPMFGKALKYAYENNTCKEHKEVVIKDVLCTLVNVWQRQRSKPNDAKSQSAVNINNVTVDQIANYAKGFKPNIQQDAHEYLMNLLAKLDDDALEHNIPPSFSSAFMGQITSSLKCSKCKIQSNKREPVFGLYIPVVDSCKSVVECIKENFIYAERLISGDFLKCSSQDCDEYLKERTLNIAIWPDVLAVQMKLFFNDENNESKKHLEKKRIEEMFDTRNLYGDGIERPSVPAGVNHRTYTLRGIVVHVGISLQSGHYNTYGKRGKVWYLFDDAFVRVASNEEIKGILENSTGSGDTKTPYVLFYVAKGGVHKSVPLMSADESGDLDFINIPALSDNKAKVVKVSKTLKSKRRR